MNKLYILIITGLLFTPVKFKAQLGFGHEIGVIAGPVMFMSDYGIRSELETNLGNTGYGVGLIHYINFSYDPSCNCYKEQNYFNESVSNGQDVELWTKIGITNLVAINNKSSVIYNFDLPNSLVKTPITKKTLMDFSQFAAAEKENKSLKKFLDIYRLEYALQFKIAGSFTQSQFYLKDITTKIPLKTRFLLQLPVSFLRFFLKIKHYLKRFGIDFTVYH
jgi:hypothetical protein